MDNGGSADVYDMATMEVALEDVSSSEECMSLTGENIRKRHAPPPILAEKLFKEDFDRDKPFAFSRTCAEIDTDTLLEDKFKIVTIYHPFPASSYNEDIMCSIAIGIFRDSGNVDDLIKNEGRPFFPNFTEKYIYATAMDCIIYSESKSKTSDNELQFISDLNKDFSNTKFGPASCRRIVEASRIPPFLNIMSYKRKHYFQGICIPKTPLLVFEEFYIPGGGEPVYIPANHTSTTSSSFPHRAMIIFTELSGTHVVNQYIQECNKSMARPYIIGGNMDKIGISCTTEELVACGWLIRADVNVKVQVIGITVDCLHENFTNRDVESLVQCFFKGKTNGFAFIVCDDKKNEDVIRRVHSYFPRIPTIGIEVLKHSLLFEGDLGRERVSTRRFSEIVGAGNITEECKVAILMVAY